MSLKDLDFVPGCTWLCLGLPWWDWMGWMDESLNTRLPRAPLCNVEAGSPFSRREKLFKQRICNKGIVSIA